MFSHMSNLVRSILFGCSTLWATAPSSAQTQGEIDSLLRAAEGIKDLEKREAAWLHLARTASFGYPEVAVPAAMEAVKGARAKDGSLATLGDALRDADMPMRSVRALQVRLSSQDGDGYPLSRLSLARSFIATQQFGKADSVLEVLAQPGSNETYFRAEVLTALGDVCLGQYKPLDAWTFFSKARALVQDESVTDREEALLLLQQSDSYLNGDRLDTALILAQRSVELFTQARDMVGRARAERGIGNVYTVIGDYAKAASHLERSVQLARKAGSRRVESMALNGLAYNSFLVLEPEVVERYWLKALALADSIGSPGAAARVRNHYGNFFLAPSTLEAYGITPEEGFARARAIIRPAIVHFDTSGDERLRMAAMLTLSNIHNYAGHLDSSRALNSRIYSIAERIADRKMMARCLTSDGAAHFLEGDFKKAIQKFERALALCTSASMGSMMGTLMYRLSQAHKNLGNYRTALEYMEQRNVMLDSLSDETKYRDMGILEAEHRATEHALADSLAHASAIRALDDQRTIAELRAERSQAWTFGLGTFLLIGGFGTWSYLRADRQRRKVQHERETARLETKALRAQMNPHFLFNALASINGFIGRNEPEVAKDFVARFGKLTRQVLENSTQNEVPLAKDLEALDLYLQLERSRSDNKFDYRINVDPAIDQQFVKVPPMVLQPLVENAIWHGMAQQNGAGMITIDISERDDQLTMQVSDNGGGMKPEQIATQSHGRTSMGTSIIRSRLELIERMKGRAAMMRYLETAIGTKVEVTIPI